MTPLATGVLLTVPARAQALDLVSVWNLADGERGLQLGLGANDHFGSSACQIDDLDGDGVPELLVGAEYQGNRGSFGKGAVFVLFLDAQGNVKSAQAIGEGQGGFQSALDPLAGFGWAVESVGDFDGNGLRDVAVSGILASSLGGSVWILSLDSTGNVVAQIEIGQGKGGFGGALTKTDQFGSSLAVIGDLDGDGVDELACGASTDNDGFFPAAGAVWVLFMNPDGTVKSETKISETSGGFSGALAAGANFGLSADGPGDVDGDGIPDLVVGAALSPPSKGRFFVLFLKADGSVRAYQEVSEGIGGFGGTLNTWEGFGSALLTLPDIDGDGADELLVGSPGRGSAGAFWLLQLQTDGTVGSEQLFDENHPALLGLLDDAGSFGTSLAYLGDAPVPFVVTGASLADSEGSLPDVGETWFLQLCDSDPAPAFDAAPTTGSTPLQVDFTSTSTGSGIHSWLWDFGDGTTSTTEHPSHVYLDAGTFTVSLTATGSQGTCTAFELDLVTTVVGAQLTGRNGSGTNPDVFDAQTLPVIGTTWLTTADGTTVGASGLSFLVAYAGQLPGVGTAFGELLVDVSSSFLALDTSILVGGNASHDVPIPNEVALVGTTASTQVLLNNPGVLTNALDLVFGY